MREYLIFSILVFIPVAVAMYFLLRRELTSKTDIAIIIGLAFLIIINFPFIIQKIGWIRAVIIYLLILYGLSLYLFKRIDLGTACSCEQKGCLPVKEYASVVAAADKTTSKPEANHKKSDDYISHIEEKSAIAANELSASRTTLSQQTERSVNNKEADDHALKETNFIAENNDIICKANLNSGSQEFQSKAVELEISPNREITHGNNSEISTNNDINNDINEVTIKDKKYVQDEANSDNYITMDLNKESEKACSEFQELVAGATEISFSYQEFNDSSRESYEIEKKVEISVQQQNVQEINVLIEEAFHYKTENNYSLAIQCFSKVLSLTEEAELKYMVLKEQIYLLKQIGQYNEAMDLIKSFINTSSIKADIMNDIKNELEYLIKLKNELEHLKLENLPIAQVPRWIKLKIRN